MIGLAGLRITLVGPVPPPAGGMATQTRQLAELLQAARAQVTLVATNAPYRPAFVGRWPGVRALFRLAPYVCALWRAAGQIDVFHVMANSGWSWHLYAAPAIWIARWRHVPVVVNYHGGEAAKFLSHSHAIVRASLRPVASVIVPSRFLEQVFGQYDIEAQVVPNIVDVARFRPAASGRLGGPRLVVTRNLEPIYDNATAIRALQIVRVRLPDAELSIAGSGPEEGRLRALVAELGLRDCVRFEGRLAPEGMAALYQSSDIALNPSLVDNMPVSILEALASGLPVVSTNVGGVPYLVQHEKHALLVPASDPQAMADAVLRLCDDMSLWRRLVEAGLAEVQRYTWATVRPQLISVYQTAIAGQLATEAP